MHKEERFDAFGFDSAMVDRTLDFMDYYYSFWHRVKATGLENIPSKAPRYTQVFSAPIPRSARIVSTAT